MITLINPNANVEVARRLDITTPPIGLGYLASVLRERGFKVKIIDDLAEKLSHAELLKRIKDSIIVGITSTTPTFNAALKYAKKIKEAFPNVFVILGGVHVTFRPREAVRHDYVDAVCVGEGEETIVEVAEKIEAGKSLDGVKGVVFKRDGRIIENPKRGFIEDLDSIPFPAFDLMPLEKYRVFGHKLEQFPMITSRGCPFSCRYCSSSLFMGRKFRARSPENVVDEIEWLVSEFNAKHIAFGDDTFTLSKRRVERICDEVKRRGIDIEWSCSSRVDTISEELLKKMKDAGCAAIYYGVESANPDILRYYNKRISLDKVRRAVELTKKVGIAVICSFIIGAPMERREDIKQTLKLAIKLDPDYAQFSILTPYPGTSIYEEAKRNGMLLTENYDEYTAGRPVLKNFHMSPDEIMRLLKYCYVRFYLRPAFILREIKKRNIGVVLGVLKRVFGG
ncbi:MAG: B12-binding domain-containing radical SAM protein [Candidatus Alkanophagales archaeon]|nr:MAG: B12-binding domain-containing radical SAM protein [Candidatus Alkanophagales archaeon]